MESSVPHEAVIVPSHDKASWELARLPRPSDEHSHVDPGGTASLPALAMPPPPPLVTDVRDARELLESGLPRISMGTEMLLSSIDVALRSANLASGAIDCSGVAKPACGSTACTSRPPTPPCADAVRKACDALTAELPSSSWCGSVDVPDLNTALVATADQATKDPLAADRSECPPLMKAGEYQTLEQTSWEAAGMTRPCEVLSCTPVPVVQGFTLPRTSGKQCHPPEVDAVETDAVYGPPPRTPPRKIYQRDPTTPRTAEKSRKSAPLHWAEETPSSLGRTLVAHAEPALASAVQIPTDPNSSTALHTDPSLLTRRSIPLPISTAPMDARPCHSGTCGTSNHGDLHIAQQWVPPISAANPVGHDPISARGADRRHKQLEALVKKHVSYQSRNDGIGSTSDQKEISTVTGRRRSGLHGASANLSRTSIRPDAHAQASGATFDLSSKSSYAQKAWRPWR